MYKDLVEYLVNSLVEDKEKVSITETIEDEKKVITVKVADEEMGRIIGKDGRIIRAIREIIRAYAAKNKDKVVISIEE